MISHFNMRAQIRTFSYKNYEELGSFITDRAKILGRDKTGLSPKEQRRLVTAIKQARHLGLLPFKARI